MPSSGSAADRLEGMVEDPVRGMLAHLHSVDIGSSEMDPEPDAGVDDGGVRELVELGGFEPPTF
jgi:hypothetical protein